MRVCYRLTAVALAWLSIIFCGTANAQGFDPRQPLSALISAFQQCGPPATYQMLSPDLFTIVAQQTGGRGCYPAMAAAGPVVQMDVLDSRAFPVGPVYAVRVTHATGPVDWFIGFNQLSGQVIYLSYQTVTSGPKPTVEKGPDPKKNIGGIDPSIQVDDQSGEEEVGVSISRKRSTQNKQNDPMEKACGKFPQMCP